MRDGAWSRACRAVFVGVPLALAVYTGPACSGDADPPEVALGERLFLETRFSFSESEENGTSDPVTQNTLTTTGVLAGPFRGQSMNCRACHLVDEHGTAPGGGNRAYSDFARRSPITRRADNNTTSPRNAQQMVDISLPRPHGLLFHYDGEFASLEDLVRATMTGRNFGWLPGEGDKAIARIAKVIRNDNGSGALAQEFGGAYPGLLLASAADIPDRFRLPKKFRIDVRLASDRQIVDRVAELIAEYIRSLQFSRDPDGNFNGSPYDRFLRKNALPARPDPGESNRDYAQRLLTLVSRLARPVFVTPGDGQFKFHRQSFIFGRLEFEGLKVFLRQTGDHAGNCAACHAPPVFSDFGFHNTGVAQREYDGLHGAGSFGRLEIPGLAERKRHYDRYLPATAIHVKATGRYRSPASTERPGYTDLGMWNVFANPDMPAPQERLNRFLCNEATGGKEVGGSGCTAESLLPMTVARFKTPILRDLGHSNPYMHNGSLDSIENVVVFYLDVAAQARKGLLRNTPPEFAAMAIQSMDITPLVAFLASLNEDYE